jgi:hypothetical protein
MNKAVRYSIIGGSVLFGAYATYLIYNGIRNQIIDSKVTSIDEANKILDNI